jgi:hypothetical protein
MGLDGSFGGVDGVQVAFIKRWQNIPIQRQKIIVAACRLLSGQEARPGAVPCPPRFATNCPIPTVTFLGLHITNPIWPPHNTHSTARHARVPIGCHYASPPELLSLTVYSLPRRASLSREGRLSILQVTPLM